MENKIWKFGKNMGSVSLSVYGKEKKPEADLTHLLSYLICKSDAGFKYKETLLFN